MSHPDLALLNKALQMPLGKQVESSQLCIFPKNFQPRPRTLKYRTCDSPNVTEWVGRVGIEMDAATVANSQEEPPKMKNRTTM